MRDKVIGLVVVAIVAALVVWVGSKLRARPAVLDAADSVAHAASDAELARADAAIVDASGEEDATLASPACLALETASKKYLDEAADSGLCVDLSLDDLGCKTSRNGATWGIRIDDVTDLEADAAACPTGWLERVVHVAADGSEQAIIPPGPGGFRNGHRYNVYKAAPVYVVAFFDFDGDGEDEAVIGRWTSIFVYAFARGRIVPYAPAAHFTVGEVKDVDGDGRPDLLVRPFGDAPTTIELLAHSLPDGTFTVHDSLAVGKAQEACPRDAPVVRDVADDVLANDIACALLWGHDASALRKELCGGDAGPCPPWVKAMLWTKPPLTLR